MSDTKTRVLLVTNELYPQRKGGIGRLLYNLLVDNKKRGYPVDISILLPSSDAASGGMSDKGLRRSIGQLATLYFCPPDLSHFEPLGALFDKSKLDDWGIYQAYQPSYLYYLSIQELLRKGAEPFDIIEFPDYGGWGYVSLEAKRAGLAFENTNLVVRLHSTLGLITAAEPYYHSPSPMMGWQQDMERHVLAHADTVIGHLAPVIKANADHYGFGTDWVDAAKLNCPPITLTQNEKSIAGPHTEKSETTKFVFSSRLQPFKRPDLFIRGAIQLLEAQPDCTADFLAVSYGWDSDYINWLRGSIPFAMRDRIKILDDVSPDERLETLRDAVIVIPSAYESLCLFAYEAGLMGNRVILNAECPAFGADTPWHHEKNCLTFDGSAHDLANQMKAALSWRPAASVIVPDTPPYWLEEQKPLTNAPTAGSPEPLSVAIVHYGYKNHQEAVSDANRRVDSKADPAKVTRYLALQKSVEDSIDFGTLAYPVIPLSGKSLLPSDLHRQLLDLDEDLILLLPSGAEADEAFIIHAQHHLSGADTLTGVAGYTLVTDGQNAPQALKLAATGCKTAAITGDAGLDLGFVFRKSLLETAEFSDQARQDWYRVFCRKLILAGEPIAALPEIAVRQTDTLLNKPDKRPIINTLMQSAGILPADIPSLGLKTDIAPRKTLEDLKPRQRFLNFYGGHRVSPSHVASGFEPVQFRKENNDLLVHALLSDTVVARLPIDTGGLAIKEVHVQMMHKGNGQKGIELALWVARDALSPKEAFKGSAPYKSEWTLITPKEKIELGLSLPEPLSELHAYVAVRLPKGADQARAWSVVTGLRLVTI